MNRGTSMNSLRKSNKLSYGNKVARDLLVLLSQNVLYGEKILDKIEQAGILGVRIEHLYNALNRDNTKFVRYVYLISAKISREKIIAAKDLSDYLAIVKKLKPLYNYYYAD